MNILIQLPSGELALVTPEKMDEINSTDQAFNLLGVVSTLSIESFSTELSIQKIEHERLEWAVRTFPEATALSSIAKCRTELDEIEADLEAGLQNPSEYADAIMCLFDSAARNGITVNEVLLAYQIKTRINKSRTWVKNPDNSYSHVK